MPLRQKPNRPQAKKGGSEEGDEEAEKTEGGASSGEEGGEDDHGETGDLGTVENLELDDTLGDLDDTLGDLDDTLGGIEKNRRVIIEINYE